jgi:hypothetical protein
VPMADVAPRLARHLAAVFGRVVAG